MAYWWIIVEYIVHTCGVLFLHIGLHWNCNVYNFWTRHSLWLSRDSIGSIVLYVYWSCFTTLSEKMRGWFSGRSHIFWPLQPGFKSHQRHFHHVAMFFRANDPNHFNSKCITMIRWSISQIQALTNHWLFIYFRLKV